MLRLEPRLSAPGTAEWLARLAGGVALALLAGVVVLALAGHDPLTAYGALLRGAFGSTRALAATINKAVPIGLCALGIALAYRAGLWNIGAEGQLYFGAFAATGIGLGLPAATPAFVALPLVLGGGAARRRRLGGAGRAAARLSRHERDPLDAHAELCRHFVGQLSGHRPLGRPADLLLSLLRAAARCRPPRPARRRRAPGRRVPGGGRRHPRGGRSRSALGLRPARLGQCAARRALCRHRAGRDDRHRPGRGRSARRPRRRDRGLGLDRPAPGGPVARLRLHGDSGRLARRRPTARDRHRRAAVRRPAERRLLLAGLGHPARDRHHPAGDAPARRSGHGRARSLPHSPRRDGKGARA